MGTSYILNFELINPRRSDAVPSVQRPIESFNSFHYRLQFSLDIRTLHDQLHTVFPVTARQSQAVWDQGAKDAIDGTQKTEFLIHLVSQQLERAAPFDALFEQATERTTGRGAEVGAATGEPRDGCQVGPALLHSRLGQHEPCPRRLRLQLELQTYPILD